MRASAALLVVLGVGCSPMLPGVFEDDAVDLTVEDAGRPDAGLDVPDGGRDAGPEPLSAVVGPDRWVDVNVPTTFDASASRGAVEYEWSFGDGSAHVRSARPSVSHTYATPGRYRAVLRVFDRRHRSKSALQLVAAGFPTVGRFQSASTMTTIEGGVAVVVADADLLTFIEVNDGGFTRRQTPTCDEPVSIANLGAGEVAVACRSGTVALHLRSGRVDADLGRGSLPVAIVSTGTSLAVALNGTNQVTFLSRTGAILRVSAVDDPSGLAATPDGGVLVGRFRSIADGGLLTWLSPTAAAQPTTLAIDPQTSSDTEIGGIPNLLAHVAVSPDGKLAVVSSLQANVTEGSFRSTKPLTFETTLRAITSFVDVPTRLEQFDRRKQWDNRGAAGAVAFSPKGDFLYVAMTANRLIERYDVLDDAPAGTLFDVGADLRGLAVSDDGRFLFVDAQLSREVVIYDVSEMRALPSAPIARLPSVTVEPLSPQLLLGKKLFHDASDPRLTRDGYIACAQCHPDGEEDGLVWDFTDRGEGLRNSISLLGRAGAGDGPIHWSGNFDEIQDFEGDLRRAFGGMGLLRDTDWMVGTTSQSLGAPKAGLSADLDALAAYVSSLSTSPVNPFLLPDGGLPDDAARGRAIFERPSVGCAVCHQGARLTDSRFIDAGVPLLHDVGTLTPGSGQRLGMTLGGIDTPTLRGLWRTPPFLHDGSARTIGEVLQARNPANRHGQTSALSPAELAELKAYLKCL